MAVLSNNVIAGASIADDAAGDDAYQIEKSIRFNSADSAYLSRNFGLGNRTTFTWAGWVKRSKLGATQSLFNCHPSSSDKAYFHLHSEDKLGHNSYDSSTWRNGGTERGPEILRDPSAWMHVVFVLDTTNAEPDDRYRYYVNGNRLTHPGGDFGVNISNSLNNAFQHNIGGNYNDSNYGDFYLADIQFIDGLALSPAAFGSFDSTGVWNPKAFALPTPNDGRTWSSSVTTNDSAGFYSGNGADKMFDGTEADGYPTNADKTITMTFNPAIEVKQGIRLQLRNGSRTHASWGSTITGTGIKQTHIKDDDCYELWPVDVDYGTKLANLTITPDSGDWAQCSRLEIDGVVLVDGQTDPTNKDWINQPGFSHTSSLSATDGGSFSTTNDVTQSVTMGWRNVVDDWVTYTRVSPATGDFKWTVPSHIQAIKCRKLRFFIYVDANNAPSATFKLNGSNHAVTGWSGQGFFGWVEFTDPPSTLTSLEYSPNSTGISLAVKAIEFNGVILQNNIGPEGANGFHLKFNDTSLNRYLGKDTLNGKIADATGGLPIYNTTDDFGEVKGSGNRTDSDSGNLDLAIAGDAFTDSSGNSVTVTASGAVISTDQSRFYGSSIFFDGSNDHITTAGSLWSANGNQTFECWIWANNITSASGHVLFDTGGSGQLLIQENSSVKRITFHPSDGNYSRSEDTIPEDEWVHIAFTQTSNTRTIFINGKKVTSYAATAGNAQTAAWNTPTGTFRIGHESANTRDYFDGYMQDIRVYDKVKYTDNFKPPTRNDFTVYNLLSASRGLNVRYYHDDSNTSFDGNSPSGDLSAVNSRWIGNPAKHTNNTGYGTNQNGVTAVFAPGGQGGSGTATFTFTGNNQVWLASSTDGGASWSGTGEKRQIYSGGDDYEYQLTGKNAVAWGGGSSDNWTQVVLSSMTSSEQEPASVIDSLTDTPTNYGEDTGAGGEVRGNYCTWNPLSKTGSSNTLSEGNLKCVTTTNACTKGTFAMTSGKWYFEYELGSSGTQQIGIIDAKGMQDATAPGGAGHNGYIYLTTTGSANTGHLYHNNTASISTWPSGAKADIVQIAYDADTGKLWWGKNNTWFNDSSGNTGNPATGANPAITVDAAYRNQMVPVCGAGGGSDAANGHVNFGQRAFKYTAPSGFKVLCTANLDDTFSGDQKNNPSKYFDIKTYTGLGADQNIKGLAFQPDLTWIKQRNGTGSHRIHDAARGAGKMLASDGNAAEYNDTAEFSAFLSDGFTLDGTGSSYNTGGNTYVSWNWDCGTAAATASTDGDITPDAQWVNATAGFSISKYEGSSSYPKTIGHGLNDAPEFIILKNIDRAVDWAVYHKDVGNTTILELNQTGAAESADSGFWNNTTPTNTVFTVGNGHGYRTGGIAETYIAYCWAPIPGYSAFGKYSANASADGPFVSCGFKPRWIMIKAASDAGDMSYAGWLIVDTKRDTYNVSDAGVFANDDHEEGTRADGSGTAGTWLDILSNGFKIRYGGTEVNGSSGQSYIYAAFAGHPFKTTRAF